MIRVRCQYSQLAFRWLSRLMAFSLWQVSLLAVDWTQYRGPNHDGISTESIRTNWTATPPKAVWRVPLQPALSSFSVGGGKVFTLIRRSVQGANQEFCIALNADSGVELWATPVGIADYPDGGVGSDDGPRSTPSLDDDRVYVLATYLKIFCLEAATGNVVWSRDLLKDFGGTLIPWQNAASPLILGDLIYLNCNARGQCLMALRKTDGSVAWKGQSDSMTQASPVAATIAGVTQVIFFTQTGLVSTAPGTGSVLWRYALPFAVSTAASPVVANDTVYCSASYGVGAGAVRIVNQGTGLVAQQVWRTRGANMNHWATPVYQEGYFYGVFGESLTRLSCVEAATGTPQWSADVVGLGEVMLVGGLALVSTDQGKLLLVKPDPSAYLEIDRFQAVKGKCWNVPAVSNGRIYIRSTTEGAAYDVQPAPPPELRLYPVFTGNDGAFGLRIAYRDGSPLAPGSIAKVTVFATSDLSADPTGWIPVPVSSVLTNGQINFDDPPGRVASQRFYKAQQGP